MQIKKNKFFDFDIFEFNSKTIIDEILDCITKNKKTIFFGMNADCFNISMVNIKYHKILKDTRYYIYPDGMSIIWAHRYLNKIRQDRIVTTDLILHLLKRLSQERKKITITFLGGNNGISEIAKNQLNKRYSIDSIQNVFEPTFLNLDEVDNPNEDKVSTLIQYLNYHPTDILFVGLGCPKQEILCNSILPFIPQKVLLPCGGLFSYYSGIHHRSPLWMQHIGLEWFFRLMLEPKRLWRRYLIGNLIFLFRMIKKKIIP